MVQIIAGTLCFLDKWNSTTLAQSKSFRERHVDSSDTSQAIQERNPSRSDLSRLRGRGCYQRGFRRTPRYSD
jgi:hypothetical protein